MRKRKVKFLVKECGIFLESGELDGNLKIGIKSGEGQWLKGIVGGGGKKDKKKGRFGGKVRYFLKNNFVFENWKLE